MDLSSPPPVDASRKRSYTSNSPTARPAPQTKPATASSPQRMMKKRKVMKRRETAFEGMGDASMIGESSVGMEVDGDVDDASRVQMESADAVADSGRMGSPVSPDFQHTSTAPDTQKDQRILPNLSPAEQLTQTYNLRGRIRSLSPTRPPDVPQTSEVMLHEVIRARTSSTTLQNVQSSDRTLVNEVDSEIIVTAASIPYLGPSTSTTITATPFAYQTPIRNRDSRLLSGITFIPETPHHAQITAIPLIGSTRHDQIAPLDSISPTARAPHLTRLGTNLLSGSPSVLSHSGYTLTLPPGDSSTARQTSASRGMIRSNGSSSFPIRSRPNENAENIPIQLDSDQQTMSLGISSPLARPHHMQLDETLERWQRSSWTQDHLANVTYDESGASPTAINSRSGTRRNVIPRYSPRNITEASIGTGGALSIRTELPGVTSTTSAAWQESNSTAIHDRSSRSFAPLTSIEDNPFVATYRSNLGRNTSLDSSTLAAAEDDQNDRDIVMQSSPLLNSSLPHESATLIQDMVGCQLESDMDRSDQASEEATTASFQGYRSSSLRGLGSRGLQAIFRPYSAARLQDQDLAGR